MSEDYEVMNIETNEVIPETIQQELTRPTLVDPSLTARHEEIKQRLEKQSPAFVDSLSVFIADRVKKLFSTRLWYAVGGTYLSNVFGNDTLVTVSVSCILGGLYILSETFIKSTNKQ